MPSALLLLRKKLKIMVFALLWQPAFALLPQPTCTTLCSQSLTNGKECVQLDHKQLYIHKAGQGTPTVIFSSGTGSPAESWFDSNIANEIARKTTVLTYDRLYTFNSCKNTNDFMPVTAATVADELHQLLAVLKLPPPYILVGHSIGGLYMLYYASHYPQEIAGILLLDATSDEGPTPLPEEAIPILKKLGNPQNPSPENFLYNEMIGQLPSYLQMQHILSFPKKIPMVVFSANRHCLPLIWTKKLMCMTSKQEENHQRKQQAMAQLSDQSQYQLISGDHHVFFTSKGRQAVINAINELLNKNQKK